MGRSVPALIALRETGLEPLTLEPKEGLALLNGTQMMSAIGALLLADADRLGRTASVIAAMSVEALLGTDVAFAAAYQLARPHPGQVAVATELRHLLRDSGLQAGHHANDHKVQDPYSLRCIPQVHGAVRDSLDHLRRVLDIELNSATDNPLVFPGGGVADASVLATGGGRVISGGNFHGEPVALALDFAKLALSELGSISERRTALLLDPRLNGGLPPFLATASGIDSGMMIYQYTAAALASENKVLVHPASADSIPTSANQEDHVSMGSIAARHARAVIENVERILAIELLVAAQALDLRLAMSEGQAAGAGVEEALARVRARVRHLDEDREPGPDLAAATSIVRSGQLSDLAGDGTVDSLTMAGIRIVDVTDEAGFGLIPPCADPRFDHRTCDYWEDADHGSKAAAGKLAERRRRARPLHDAATASRPSRPTRSLPTSRRPPPVNPFATARPANPFLTPGDDDDGPLDNPFAPPPKARPTVGADAPRKLQLLGRGLGVAGSYAKVLLLDDEPAAYAQFGPLTAYPRAMRTRELYPALPVSPPPAVITCIATTRAARGVGLAKTLVGAVCDDLSERGFAVVESYPEVGADPDATSAATPAFWESVGFTMAIADARFPVMRRELG